MRTIAEKLFYTLGAIVLGAGIFVLQPISNSDTGKFQHEARIQFSTAAIQVFGDQPVFDNVNLVVDSINKFYAVSADALIAILEPAPSEQGLAIVSQGVYEKFATLLNPDSNAPEVAGAQIENPRLVAQNFMAESPIYNIVPDNLRSIAPTAPPTPFVQSAFHATVAASDFVQAVNDGGDPWVNVRDNITGQVYCVAIFNAEVNRYLGSCRNDYH